MQSLALLVLSLVLSVSADDGDCEAAFSACAAQVQAAMIADSNAGEKSNQVKMGVPISALLKSAVHVLSPLGEEKNIPAILIR